MKKKKYFRGFTLIELLVVVAIIGTLAAVVLASLGGARDSARVTAMAQEMRNIEQAMIMWGLDEGFAEWPEHTEAGNTINDIIANTNLSEYLPEAPEPAFGDTIYRYRKQGEAFECGDPAYFGVTLSIVGATVEDARELDRVIDGGESVDLDCGKLRWRTDAQQIRYSLSNDFAL